LDRKILTRPEPADPDECDDAGAEQAHWKWRPNAEGGQQQKDITILDRFGNAAVVKIVASGWMDYLEEVKFDGQWKITNVLWELKSPSEQQKSSPA
jgi:Putative lumazine-binding